MNMGLCLADFQLVVCGSDLLFDTDELFHDA